MVYTTLEERSPEGLRGLLRAAQERGSSFRTGASGLGDGSSPRAAPAAKALTQILLCSYSSLQLSVTDLNQNVNKTCFLDLIFPKYLKPISHEIY